MRRLLLILLIAELATSTACSKADRDDSGEFFDELSILQHSVATDVKSETFKLSPDLSMQPAAIQRDGIFRTLDKAGSQKSFKILGLQHTGTHLLEKVLTEGFGSSMFTYGPNHVSSDKCGFWKHAYLTNLLQKAPDNFEGCEQEAFIGLAMIRNPLAWLQAVRNNPYEFEDCTEGGNDAILEPCKLVNESQVEMSMLADVTFPNMGVMWSRWNTDYESLGSFSFHENLVIRYEDLVLHDDGPYREIAELADLNPVRDPEKWSEKLFGSNHGSWASREEIITRSYLRKYTARELRQVCEQLDIKLMRRYGYHDCDEVL